MLPGLAAPTLSRDLRSLPTRRVAHLNPACGCSCNVGTPVARFWLPSMKGACQGGGPGDFECAPALVGVNVVRPAGRSTLTPRARRRGVAPAGAAGVVLVAGGGGSVLGAGPGSGWSEVPVPGGRPAALDNRVAPECPPGPVL